jgi:hypothetical protein
MNVLAGREDLAAVSESRRSLTGFRHEVVTLLEVKGGDTSALDSIGLELDTETRTTALLQMMYSSCVK